MLLDSRNIFGFAYDVALLLAPNEINFVCLDGALCNNSVNFLPSSDKNCIQNDFQQVNK